MSIEIIIWIIVPNLLALGGMALSLAALRRRRNAPMLMLSAVVFVLGGLGFVGNVYQVVIEAWPTFLFDLMIGGAVVAALIQAVSTASTNRRATESSAR